MQAIENIGLINTLLSFLTRYVSMGGIFRKAHKIRECSLFFCREQRSKALSLQPEVAVSCEEAIKSTGR